MIKRLLFPIRKLMGRFVILPSSQSNVDQQSIIFKAAQLIAECRIEGDYYEFGVFKGRSFIHAYNSVRQAFDIFSTPGYFRTEEDCLGRKQIWDRMKYHAFDSFEGLPGMDGADSTSKVFKQGQFACSRDEFIDNITKGGVPLEKVEIIPGWYEQTCTRETINKHKLRKASIIFIDVDLYSSAKTVLQFATNIIQDGTVIIFDDWFHFNGSPFFGEQRAFREWAKTLNGWVFTEFHKEGAFSNSFIVNNARNDFD